MDSMRSLNTSLPGTSPPKQQVGESPEQLLQAFKSAALAVTTLYKTAAAKQSKARAEGYQDALDELLSYLDKENIGLSDGEGWGIRRWATERLDGRDSMNHNVESEDEVVEKNDGPSSPVLQRAHSSTRLSPNPTRTRAASPTRSDSAPPNIPTPQSPVAEPIPISIPQQSQFTFRASHQYPQESETIISDLEMSDNNRTHNHDGSVNTSNPTGITISRPSRAGSRHNNHPSRNNTRTAATIGRGAGQKRKINIGDFFDIGNLGPGKDNFGGGGKRGRFI
ncbi:hypothetical protein GLAREA_07201 [Glarea lozoyensis ATCC 20868]|uniref:Uncharacterized protein n=1 Tax=Glarea lozoyensis (strain ATCC 20868 / MF5171) TaxID=1116229 RepID=S3E783_GLAL2|nr:uncharacterized protein GLAREA_07201 [Glarea lozoyensis ATCC 20868]EPE34188.1 hypothetical protein GLAREA_07201 [Glarea lozoyensis ATCC 20868]